MKQKITRRQKNISRLLREKKMLQKDVLKYSRKGRQNSMFKKCKNAVIILLCAYVLTGCSSINVGGSGKIGDITGGGGVNIPIPQKDVGGEVKNER
ncbi:MAG: hypothetical protein KKB22_06730 [Candidatus Omnitrophica bacterium]|nr:hypothetical protein [Candidatus Omnitrophota bacterium]